MAARWSHRPDGSTWDDFGPDDQLGRLNLITPGRVCAAALLAQWLRQTGRHRFMLTAPPLRLPGATGSPATPISTV
jgi:hypothetical protein